MQIISIFDDGYPPRPLLTSIYDGSVETIPLYIKGTKKSLYDVQQNIQYISDKINNSSHTILNDAKSHINTYKITTNNIYQTNIQVPNNLSHNQYNNLFKKIFPLPETKEFWRQLVAVASRVYLKMESNEVYLDEQRVHPRYTLDTFSGRSKCTNFNIQGAQVNDPIKVRNHDMFLCLDWVAADLRIAALMSGDPDLLELFKSDDPYATLAESLDISRQECKLIMLKTMYALDLESPILELFPILKQWITDQLKDLDKNGYLTSLLGRKYKIKDRGAKSVFNARLQGTVAHAMHSALIQMFDKLGQYLLTETHDSVIFTCNSYTLPAIIKEASQIMVDPLNELSKMPVKVYVGKAWRKWKLYKVIR